MPKPVLFAVDRGESELDCVESELRRRYHEDYRVEAERSPARALERLTRLSDAGEDVAIVLAGQELGDEKGSAVLARVRQLHPHAKRGLLVPWGVWDDREATESIQRSMALGQIDYYVLRPASSPDEQFHQAVSGFLYEWARERRVAAYAVRVVGEPWSRRSHELRELFERNGIPNVFCSPESPEGRAVREQVGPAAPLPIVVLPNRSPLADPSDVEIAEAYGVPVEPVGDEFDLVVAGAGPAGLSAAVYGASEGLRTLVVDPRGIGGQAASSSKIRNYLGFPRGIGGADLASRAYQQAWVFGTRFAFTCLISGLERTGDGLALTLSDGERVAARTVVLATGASYRRLGIDSLEDLVGAGVFYGGAAAEAPRMKDEEVWVVGGANSAGQAALHLARHARRVTLLVRSPSLDEMSSYLVHELGAAGNVEFRLETTVVAGGGSGRLEHLVLADGRSGERESVPARALFVLIGARPRTKWLPSEVARDPRGFVLTGPEVAAAGSAWPLERPPFLLETSLPGVFAIGDVRNGSVKRVASAVGEGSVAIQQVHALLARERLGSPTAA